MSRRDAGERSEKSEARYFKFMRATAAARYVIRADVRAVRPPWLPAKIAKPNVVMSKRNNRKNDDDDDDNNNNNNITIITAITVR